MNSVFGTSARKTKRSTQLIVSCKKGKLVFTQNNTSMSFDSIMSSIKRIYFNDLEKLTPGERLNRFDRLQREFKELETNIAAFSGSEEEKGLLQTAEAKKVKEYAAALRLLNSLT
jgi:hypothetical protein